MARLFATSSALALLALPLPTNAQGLVITTPQAGVTVTAGTTYLQIIGTTITGNVTVPQGVVLAPGPGNGQGSALAVSNSTINGAILNAGTVSVSLPKDVYVQNAISVSNGSQFSNAGGAATGVTNTGLLSANASATNTSPTNEGRGIYLGAAVGTLGAILNAGTITAIASTTTGGKNASAYASGIGVVADGNGSGAITNTGLIQATGTITNAGTAGFAITRNSGVYLEATAGNAGAILNAGTINVIGSATGGKTNLGYGSAIRVIGGGSGSGAITNTGLIQATGSASVANSGTVSFGIARARGVYLTSAGNFGAILNTGTVATQAAAMGSNYPSSVANGIHVVSGASASGTITNAGLILGAASATVTNSGTAVSAYAGVHGIMVTNPGGISTMRKPQAQGDSAAISVINSGTINGSAAVVGRGSTAEAFGLQASPAGGTARAPNTQAYGGTLTGTFTNSGLIALTAVASGSVAGRSSEAFTSDFQAIAGSGTANHNAAAHFTPTHAVATGGVLIGSILNTGTLIAVSVANGDAPVALVDSGFSIGSFVASTDEPGSTVTNGTIMGGATNSGVISVTVTTSGTNSNGNGFAQTEAFHVDAEQGSALAANAQATGALIMGNVVNTGLITNTAIGLIPQANGLLVLARGGRASGSNAQATGGTFIGSIANSGTVISVASGGTGVNPANAPSASGVVIDPIGGTAKGAGATASAGTIIGNVVNSGFVFASLASSTGTAAGIVVGEKNPGVFRGGITNSGVIIGTASGGATGVGIKLFIPVPAGITNSGTIEGSTNALDFSHETGGSTAFLQTAGLLSGGIAGGGGDTVTLSGGTLQLAPTNKVTGLASFTLGAGATLGFEVAPGQAPSVTAGAVSLAGGLQVSGLAPSEVFPNVVVGTNSLSGAFSSITSTTPGLHAAVIPDSTTPHALDLVILNPQQGGNFAELLRLGLQQPQSMWTAIQSRMVLGGGSASASGSLSASLNGAGGTVLADASATGNAEAGGGLWARGYGVLGMAPGTASGSSFDANRAGVILGGDWRVADGIVVGGAFDYGHTGVNFGDGAGSMSVDGYEIAGYAGWRDGPWYANGVAAMGWNDYGTTRTVLGVPSASGSTSGMSYSAYGEAGYGLAYGDLKVTPYASLGYVDAQVDAFTESGGGSAFAVHSGAAASLVSTLGLRASLISLDLGAMGTWMPEVRAGWQHEFLDAQQSIGLSFAAAPGLGVFSVTGSNFGRDGAVVGLSVSDQVTSSARVFLNYDGMFTVGGYNSQAVSGGVRIRF